MFIIFQIQDLIHALWAKRTRLPIFQLQLTVITFVVSEFLFAIGAFLWDRRLVKVPVYLKTLSRQERVWCSSSWKSISYQRMVTHNKETIFTFLIYHMPCTYLKILPIISLSFIYLVILLLFTSHRLASRYPWVSSESQRGVGQP